MRPISTGSNDLDLDDFRRLGVRPHECRLTVIRQAAARNTKSLAERQLRAPTEPVALQLSRVATSAYRLLDPRQRHDSHQRAHVGRILPNALAWAGQTSFHNGSAGPTQGLAVPFQSDRMSDAELIDSLVLDSSPVEHEDTYALSLSADDLLVSTPLSRAHASVRRRARRVWLPLTFAGAVVAATILVINWRDDSDPLAARLVAPTPAPAGDLLDQGDVAVPRQGTLPVQGDAEISTAVSGEKMVREKVVREKVVPHESVAPAVVPPVTDTPSVGLERQQKVESNSSPDLPLDIDADPAETGPLEQRPASEAIAMSDRDALLKPDLQVIEEPEFDPLAKPDIVSPANLGSDGPDGVAMSRPDDAKSAPGDAKAAPGESEFLVDPFDAGLGASPIPPVSDLAANAPDVDMPGRVPSLDTMKIHPDALPSLRALPDADQVTLARARMISLMPSLDAPVALEDVDKRIEQVDSLRGELEVGSADHFAASLIMVELAWLVDDISAMRSRLNIVSGEYLAAEYPHLVSTYVGARRYAASDDARKHLLRNGLILCEQLLLNESIDLCQRTIVVASRLAETVDDATSLQHLEQFEQSVIQMTRLVESTDRAMAGFEGVGRLPGDAGIAGRYYCLMLRRWDTGLIWLTETSDARIGSIARQESELPGSATADALVELAGRWLAAASRANGRAADSMRLHALDLLRTAKQKSTGLRKLEIEREIETNQAELPFFLIQPLGYEPTSGATLYNGQIGSFGPVC